MHERYLGDSFDVVKRFWRELLSPIAPMFAHPRFIPAALQASFTRLTTVPIWDGKANAGKDYSLLLDPHTGIPMPDAAMNELRISHAPIGFISGLFKDSVLRFIVCFDQTADRQHDLCIADQRDAKRHALRAAGIYSFYYLSHAPFLFASNKPDMLKKVRQAMVDAGFPETTSSGTRLQRINEAT